MFPKFKKFYIVKSEYSYGEYEIKWEIFDPKTKNIVEIEPNKVLQATPSIKEEEDSGTSHDEHHEHKSLAMPWLDDPDASIVIHSSVFKLLNDINRHNYFENIDEFT